MSTTFSDFRQFTYRKGSISSKSGSAVLVSSDLEKTQTPDQAINTLGVYALKEEHLEQIQKNLKDDTLGPDQYYYVLGILKKYEKSNSQIVQKSLEEMARRSMHADLHSQVTNMLKNMKEKK